MRTQSQQDGRIVHSRAKKARLRALVALVAGVLMVFGATQAIDTRAVLQDEVTVKSGQLAVDANLLPRPQFVSCVDQSSAPNPQSTYTWKHLGPGYSYRIEVRWRDGSYRFDTNVAPGGSVGRGTNVSYVIDQNNVWALGSLGRNMSLRVLPVLNGVVGANWVGVYLHIGSAQHMYCNGGTWGSGAGSHIYPINLLDSGDPTPLARGAEPLVGGVRLAPEASGTAESGQSADEPTPETRTSAHTETTKSSTDAAIPRPQSTTSPTSSPASATRTISPSPASTTVATSATTVPARRAGVGDDPIAVGTQYARLDEVDGQPLLVITTGGGGKVCTAEVPGATRIDSAAGELTVTIAGRTRSVDTATCEIG